MTFCITLKGWALLIECDSWAEAQACADDIGADLQGEKVGEVDAPEMNCQRLIN